jgi:hypothetical protein
MLLKIFLLGWMTLSLQSFYAALGGNEFLKFNLLKCKGSDEFFYPNYTCYAKAYNRSFSAINGYVMSRKPIYEIWVSSTEFFYFSNITIKIYV